MKSKLFLNKFFNKSFRAVFLLLVFLFLVDFLVGDTRVFLLINKNLSHSALDFAFLHIFVPLFLLIGIIPLVILLFKNYRLLGGLALFTGFLCYLIGEMIKFSPRPAQVLTEVNLAGNWAVGSFSFPSTTTMLAFGLSLPIFIIKPKLGLPLLVLAFLVGFFVIYSGYHFPQDAIAGAALSLIITSLLFYTKEKLNF
ncbi:phosphatase PAP2 family protein [Candidatus Parcubacteria bacterium]|nr:phosphatase PAP2 family protein [Candidatus Parcubacteria bacterium]